MSRSAPAKRLYSRAIQLPAKLLIVSLVWSLFSFSFVHSRTWRSADGKSAIEADIVRADDKQVTLRFDDGREGTHNLSFFSLADQIHVGLAVEVVSRSTGKQGEYLHVLKRQGKEALCQWGRYDNRAKLVRFDGPYFVLVTNLEVRKGTKLKVTAKLWWCGEIPETNPPISYFAESADEAISFLGEYRASLAKKQPTSQPMIPPPDNPVMTMGFGTCFAIADDGYCLTNHHVTKGASDIQLRVQDREVPARIVSENAKLDLAVIKTEWRTKPLRLRLADNVSLGDKVFTIGFPKPDIQGIKPKFTEGVISSLAGIRDNPLHYQHSAPQQSGNSGGALVDEYGSAVGIIIGALADEDAENVNYAIKGSAALEWLKTLPELSGKLVSTDTAAWDYATAKQIAEAATALVQVSISANSPAAPSVGTAQFSLSKSGVRHNSRCRYFDSARACDASDGRACKLCGG